MENFEAANLSKYDSKLFAQLSMLKQKYDEYTENFWRLGFKMLHQDPDCELGTYFEEYFPSKEEFIQKFEDKRKHLKEKRLSDLEIVESVIDFYQNDRKNLDRNSGSNILTRRSSIYSTNPEDIKKKGIFTSSSKCEEFFKSKTLDVPATPKSPKSPESSLKIGVMNCGDKIEIHITKSTLEALENPEKSNELHFTN